LLAPHRPRAVARVRLEPGDLGGRLVGVAAREARGRARAAGELPLRLGGEVDAPERLLREPDAEGLRVGEGHQHAGVVVGLRQATSFFWTTFPSTSPKPPEEPPSASVRWPVSATKRANCPRVTGDLPM